MLGRSIIPLPLKKMLNYVFRLGLKSELVLCMGGEDKDYQCTVLGKVFSYQDSR